MELTNEIILNDIAGFEARIAEARKKLAGLKESTPSNWKEKKRLKAKKRVHESEITHCQGLIDLAKTAVTPSECQPGQP